jgi:hypothetical protein
VSDKLTIKEIDDAFNSICKENGTSANASKLVVELIDEEAKECLAPNSPAMNIEIKLVLAIGIRLTAERFMINKIADDAFLATIKGHQTQKLVREYKKRFELDVQNCKTLDKVELMTPENIHVNSFMYEPIIDMADDSLKKLYTDVLALK